MELDHCFLILVLLHVLTGCEGEKAQARVPRYRALHWHCFCTYFQWRRPLKLQMQLKVHCNCACETCPWHQLPGDTRRTAAPWFLLLISMPHDSSSAQPTHSTLLNVNSNSGTSSESDHAYSQNT